MYGSTVSSITAVELGSFAVFSTCMELCSLFAYEDQLFQQNSPCWVGDLGHIESTSLKAASVPGSLGSIAQVPTQRCRHL